MEPPCVKGKRRRWGFTAALSAMALVLTACGGARVGDDPIQPESCVDTSGDTVKVGFINSLSGTMAISETTVNQSLNMAAAEINESGGVMGKQLEIVEEDGASDPAVFAERAARLIEVECVAAVFGGWTSASRKAMLPVFESNNSLLFYPVQYEGLEASSNVYYTGSTTNQQIVPGLEYLKNEEDAGKLFLLGSDYVFPRAANMIIKQWAEENDVEIVGEDYTPLGSTDFTTIANRVRNSGADAVFNTLNGDSNVAFFRQYRSMGLTPEQMPVLSVSLAEEEVGGIGVDNIGGQLTAWNYYQSVDTPENEAFVERFKDRYGENRPTSDPMTAAYTSLYLWREMVEAAGSFDVDDVRENADGVSFEGPEGLVTVDGATHHVTRTPRIGRINEDGLIDTIWEDSEPLTPDPFLDNYTWSDIPLDARTGIGTGAINNADDSADNTGEN